MTPKIVMITGANSGLGYDSARQLAGIDGVEKVLLACRNKEKADAAKRSLAKATGKTSMYEIVLMDVSSLDSVRKAVDGLTYTVDAVVLNAGGGGGMTPAAMTDDGVTTIFGANVLGHVLLVDLLLEQKKISSGGTVMLAGSEVARGVPQIGMAKPVLKNGSIKELTAIADGSRFTTPKEQTVDGMYGITKLVATLWIGSMARKEPSIRFVTMSPGMSSGTAAMDAIPFVQKMFFKILMKVMTLLGKAHTVETGAKRYVDALMETDTYKTGRFYASKVGASGEVVDQEIHTDVFYKEDYQDNANTTIHKFIR